MRLFLSVRPEDTICYRVAEENNVLFLLVLWAGGGVVILTLQSFSVVRSDFCTSSRFKQKPELFTLKIYIKKEFIRKCCFQHEWLSNQRQTSTGEHSQITWWETALCFFMEQCCTSGFCHLTFSQRNEAVCWLLQLVNSQNNRRNDNLHTSVNMRACVCVFVCMRQCTCGGVFELGGGWQSCSLLLGGKYWKTLHYYNGTFVSIQLLMYMTCPHGGTISSLTRNSLFFWTNIWTAGRPVKSRSVCFSKEKCK